MKIQELNKKEVSEYGENYMDWNIWFVHVRLLALNWEFKLKENFQRSLEGHTDKELKRQPPVLTFLLN